MLKIWVRAAVAALLLVVFANSSNAAKRLALVIGNDIYKNLPQGQQLKKARNDARAIAKTLEGSGFKVTLGLDVTRSMLNQKLDVFASQIEPGDIAMVFFAGHGVRINGRNYLLPADVPDMSRGSQDLLARESIAVDSITDTIKEKGARIALLILDACRNNPFKDNKGRSVGGTRGLARMDPPEGTFVLFSAGTGQEALDRLSDVDQNPNSVFTRLLIPLLQQKGLEVGRMADLLRQRVKRLAATVNHLQTPASYDEVTGDFYLVPSQPVQVAPQLRPLSAAAQEWATIQNTTSKAILEAFIKRHSSSSYSSYARVRLNEIKSAALTPDAAPKTSIADRRQLTIDLQKELKRVGCDSGRPDGQWGNKSSAAMKEFNAQVNLALPTAIPSRRALKAVKVKVNRVCPLKLKPPVAAARRVQKVTGQTNRSNFRSACKAGSLSACQRWCRKGSRKACAAVGRIQRRGN